MLRRASLAVRSGRLGALAACAIGFPLLGCSSSSSGGAAGKGGTDGGPSILGQGDSGGTLGPDDASDTTMDGSTPVPAADASGAMPPGDSSTGDSSTVSADGGFPAGWLYTSGSKIYESSGASGGTPWMGRGVNTDDIFLCGYDNTLWMTTPDQTVETIVSGLVSGWKPNFIRISLAMDSYGTSVSFISDPSQYKTPMVGVINAIGAHPGVHVLVTLRSDASMIGQDTADGDPEATGIPSDSTTTPDKGMYPTGTDATYVALVDSFANASFVMFGLTNEPGGNKLTSATIAAAMQHAAGTIRAEEDRLGVPHHIVSVQGNGWTSDISYYATKPITYDNVVYEVHGYPPATSSYTYSSLPVILGEYGSLTDSTTFYADVESKQIPNLAWDFDPYSDCAPDLVTVNQSATTLTPTAWGTTVKNYLSKP
jgi:hypothetical protein